MAISLIYTSESGESFTRVWNSQGGFVGIIPTHLTQIRKERESLLFKPGDKDITRQKNFNNLRNLKD